MKKKIAGVGLGALLTSIVFSGQIPQTPEEAITWTDFAVHFISQAGMPGTIIVLMATLAGAFYYWEFVKIPKLHEHYADLRKLHTKDLDDTRAEVKRLNGDALTYRDSIMERLEKIIVDGITANTRIEGIFTQVLDFLKKKGKNNGTV